VIDDSARCTLGRIRARLRGMSRSQPARLVIVDYLGLMEPPRADNREQQVAAMSRGMKLLAKEFGVPIVVLSQLNRESTKRTDRRPAMSDLRDSGCVEQDADVVILLHRDDADEKEHPRAGTMDLIVAKNRNGPTGVVTVAFQGHYARAVDMAREWSPTAGLSGAGSDAA
jgi:replicative DNA helicase